MHENRVVPALTPVEAEEFRSGEDALADPGPVPGTSEHLDTRPPAVPVCFRKLPGHSCCVGIDMPEVGHVHSLDCPATARHAATHINNADRWLMPPFEIPPARSGRGDAGADPRGQGFRAGEYLPGHVPEPLRSFISDAACRVSPGVIGKGVRELIAEIDAAIMRNNEKRDEIERLLGQLLFASRDLAERNILGRVEATSAHGDKALTPAWCRECRMTENVGKIPHAASCYTGRVLGLLDALMSLELNSDGKETGEETGRAGDGTRLRGLKERVCLKCGARGGRWMVAEVPAATFDLSQLGLNQLSGGAFKSDEVAIYTHLCDDHSGAVASAIIDEMIENGGAR